jgi:aspartate-semialdehyde dehydrogenase
VHADVSTYLAVSDSGKAGVDELSGQVVSLLNMRDVSQSVFSQRIAFNVIPQIGEILDNGYSEAEMKLVTETQKILAETAINITPTVVQVPVFYGHSLAVHLQLAATVTVDEARAILESVPGLALMDKPGEPTPAIQATDQDAVLVGRLREDLSRPGGLNLWITSDNSRKGAALNAVQIAELLEKCYM